MKLSGAIRNGTAGPPELESYRIRRAFWERLGETRESLRTRPWRDVDSDITVMSAEIREENAQAERARRGR